MALGVAPARRCPDQVASESARKAYVDQALYVPPDPKPVAKKSTPKSVLDEWSRNRIYHGGGGTR